MMSAMRKARLFLITHHSSLITQTYGSREEKEGQHPRDAGRVVHHEPGRCARGVGRGGAPAPVVRRRADGLYKRRVGRGASDVYVLSETPGGARALSVAAPPHR